MRDQETGGDGRRVLSREGILKAALAIADEDGLDRLTIRKLAARLGVSPMGVYRYFRNKAEIVDGLVDVVEGEYDVTNHQEPDWTEWVRESFRLMRRALRAHPGILPLVGSAARSGTNAMRVMEDVLEVLCRAGIDRGSAASVFQTLTSYTIGAVASEGTVRGQSVEKELDAVEQLRQSRLHLEAVSRPQYPRIVELAEHLALFDTEEEFLRGIDRILAGLKVEIQGS